MESRVGTQLLLIPAFALGVYQKAFRPDDESLGRRPHEIERIAGDQSKRFGLGWEEHSNIIRLDDFGGDHPVPELSAQRSQRDCVILANAIQRTKERVSMAGDPYVASLSRERG